MKKSIIYSLAIALVTLVVACGEDSDSSEGPTANVNPSVDRGIIEANDSTTFRMLLTDSVSKTWDASVFLLAGSNTFTSCRLDDYFTFFTDGTYDYSGGRLCGAEDTDKNRSGSWELDYTDKKIYFDRRTSKEYVAEVIGLQENELKVVGSYMRMEVRATYTVR